MASFAFKGTAEYALKLAKLADDEMYKKAIFAAADIVADKIKSNMDALPTDKFRHLGDGEQFSGVPAEQKRDLQDSFGIAPIARDNNGDWNTKLGFDGYGSIPTRKYPQGVPNQLLARAVESGSSVRRKTPFVRPAVTAAKKAAYEAMGQVVDAEIEKKL